MTSPSNIEVVQRRVKHVTDSRSEHEALLRRVATVVDPVEPSARLVVPAAPYALSQRRDAERRLCAIGRDRLQTSEPRERVRAGRGYTARTRRRHYLTLTIIIIFFSSILINIVIVISDGCKNVQTRIFNKR